MRKSSEYRMTRSRRLRLRLFFDREAQVLSGHPAISAVKPIAGSFGPLRAQRQGADYLEATRLPQQQRRAKRHT